jgi:nicotinamidase-related amidase
MRCSHGALPPTRHTDTMTRQALLVIDLQRGAFDGARCPVIAGPQSLIDNAVRLVSSARESRTPVVFIRHCETEAGSPFEEGTAHGELHEALQPQPGDTLLKKYASSAFEGTDLAATLQTLGASELVVCGLQSEFCVSNTTRSALALGFAVVVAQDGHGTWPSGGETAAAISARANQALAAAGATLRSSADLARSLRVA